MAKILNEWTHTIYEGQFEVTKGISKLVCTPQTNEKFNNLC